MKRNHIQSLRGFIGAAAIACTLTAGAQDTTTLSWDFTSTPETDIANLNADATNWKASVTGTDTSVNRWANTAKLSSSALIANGQELEMTKGLKFSAGGADKIRIDKNSAIRLNGSKLSITIPGLSEGAKVTVICETANSSDARSISATNLRTVSGFTSSTERQTNVGTVTAAGDVTVTTGGGMAFYTITVEGNENGGGDTPTPPVITDDHSVKMNTTVNQMLLRTTGGDVKYYNTVDLAEVNIDKENGVVSVMPKTGDWNDEFKQNIAAISFAKAPETGEDAEIVNRGVSITEAKGWLESVYCKWELLEGASSYRIYIKGGKYADYTPVDRELARNYGTYGRADIPGLPAGVYSLKVVPVINGEEVADKASEATAMNVRAYDRSGFAHFNFNDGIGAYKDNGELKDDARVIYVTAETAKTVTCKVKQSNKDGDGTVFTGLQSIIDAYQKGVETRPLAVRIIGLVKKDDLDKISSSAEGLQIKGKNNTIPMNITIEGVGDDATTWGFGFLLRNACSVELRNFANMLCMDDCVSIDTDNRNCWVHHLDLFYGSTGGDSDQAKGDGTVDIKGDSQYITVAYNRFHDSGKSSLCGMKSETGPNYIDYHHNWFDHSDSRHPRVRTMTVHVWNNYFDGCAKYGVGATTGASVFVENNFYRSTKYPMLISQQGHDPEGSAGTFSKEDGGMIKSFGNVYAETAGNDRFTPTTQKISASAFDCYEADSADEKVPETYKTVYGDNVYNNFDTDPTLMYVYTPLEATEVPAIVTGYFGAGRLNHGDFIWDMNYPGADTDYSVITALKAALSAYSSKLVGIFE